MTGPEIFKLDVRIRERMLRKGLLSEAEVNKHLEALPDVASQGEDLVLRQPALHGLEGGGPMRPKNPAPPRSVPPPVPAAPINVDEAGENVDDDDWGESP
jgi:hypothetical protein